MTGSARLNPRPIRFRTTFRPNRTASAPVSAKPLQFRTGLLNSTLTGIQRHAKKVASEEATTKSAFT
jgi:hypothetical protein